MRKVAYLPENTQNIHGFSIYGSIEEKSQQRATPKLCVSSET
jgi:hypothetical protein